MGKKGKTSRRRGEGPSHAVWHPTLHVLLPSNVTADDLDDDTAKPRAPLLAPELHYHEKHGIPYDDPVDRARGGGCGTIPRRQKSRLRGPRSSWPRTTTSSTSALSGMGLTAENFVDSCALGLVVRTSWRLIKHGVDTGGDKNALEYLVTKQEELSCAVRPPDGTSGRWSV